MSRYNIGNWTSSSQLKISLLLLIKTCNKKIISISKGLIKISNHVDIMLLSTYNMIFFESLVELHTRLYNELIKQRKAKVNTWGTTWTCFTRLKTWLLPLEGSLVFAPGQVFSGLILPFNLRFCFAILLGYLKLIILMIIYCHLLIAQGQLYEQILGKQYLVPFCF